MEEPILDRTGQNWTEPTNPSQFSVFQFIFTQLKVLKKMTLMVTSYFSSLSAKPTDDNGNTSGTNEGLAPR